MLIGRAGSGFAADAASKTVANDRDRAERRRNQVVRRQDARRHVHMAQDTKREDPRKVFTVSDGMIHISGDGYGGLVTNKRYRDYHLCA